MLYWVKLKILLESILPTSFYFFHVGSRKFEMTHVPFITFLLDSVGLVSGDEVYIKHIKSRFHDADVPLMKTTN